MKKKKIELGTKLFMKKDTISSLGARQSGKVVGGWATHYAETQVVAEPGPYCMSCPPPIPSVTPTCQSQCFCAETQIQTCRTGVTGC